MAYNAYTLWIMEAAEKYILVIHNYHYYAGMMYKVSQVG